MKETQDYVNLSFTSIRYSKRAKPWTLEDLLVPKSRIDPSVDRNANKPRLDDAALERRRLVIAIYDEINAALIGGGSRQTAYNRICRIKTFFGWADENNHVISTVTVEQIFLKWTDYLLHRHRANANITHQTLYSLVATVSSLLDQILGKHVKLLSRTRMRPPYADKAKPTPATQKQNLDDTRGFGRFLRDVCRSLTLETINGTLPILISTFNNPVFEHWSGLIDEKKLCGTLDARYERRRRALRSRRAADTSLNTRYSVVNLRIEAELLMFIAETGMNLAQAYRLKVERFHFTSHLDGYEVREYKARRSGEVAFEIRGEYKTHFEQYLVWRDHLFRDAKTEELFPLITKARIDESAPPFHALKSLCKRLEVTFVGPRQLRHTRINWLLRRSNDPDMTAEIAQHTRQTLFSSYREPHLQTAMTEISSFHSNSSELLSAIGPGACVSIAPEQQRSAPKNVPVPDCVNPAGCLFCSQQRDIDSQDYLWALASFRHLKVIELTHVRPPPSLPHEHPTEVVIARITEKLNLFEKSSSTRAEWIHEVQARLDEGSYHPYWDGFIQLQEI